MRIASRFPLIGAVVLLTGSISAQNTNWCASQYHLEKQIEKDPSIKQLLIEQEEQVLRDAEFINSNTNGQRGVVRVIPVVFQIMHAGGTENISKEQCLDALDRLNKDFRRQNSDASSTPAAFSSIAADIELEFRLAQKDPQGNCTDGIVRTFTHQTSAADDNIKYLSSWDTKKYLNIWVVKHIAFGASETRFTAGYAQWPGAGASTTDGVVIRHDYVGGIGTATAPLGGANGLSRTITHEVGHWYGLKHIWGDSNCGNDNVTDTPRHQDANQGCPTFPKTGSCSGVGSNGEMFMNYMDYTNGGCQNMFTVGQKTRMQTYITGSLRRNLYSASNLAATGTDGTPAVPCKPVAEFSANRTMICEGGSVTFSDESWNGDADSWSWTFTGGTPASSVGFAPTISYNAPGSYPVTFSATNSGGTGTTSKTAYINVYPTEAKYEAPHAEDVENNIQVNTDWIFNNDDNSAYKWIRTNAGEYQGNYGFKMNNFGNNAGQVDELISPSVDLRPVTGPEFVFRLAHAQRSADTEDQLKVMVSYNCGQSWITRWSKKGEFLSTVGVRSSPFTPVKNSENDWDEIRVNLGPYTNRENVRIKFEFTSDDGNHLYIDNINFDGLLSTGNSLEKGINLEVYPNPFSESVTINFSGNEREAELKLYDITGRELWASNTSLFGNGSVQLPGELFSSDGIYVLKLQDSKTILTRRIIYKKD